MFTNSSRAVREAPTAYSSHIGRRHSMACEYAPNSDPSEIVSKPTM
jgi:hypothetical protein